MLACACIALALAGCCKRQSAGGGAAQSVTLARLARDPAALQGQNISVIGRLRNAGGNYFTGLRLELADNAGAAVAVRPWLPLEVPPARPGAAGNRPAVLSDYLGKNVRITGCWGKEGSHYELEVQQAEIITEAQE